MAKMGLVVMGAAGRMGRMLVCAIAASEHTTLVAAVEQKASSHLGQDAGTLAGIGEIGVPLSDDPLAAVVRAEGIVDFTSPPATVEFAALAAQARIVHVIGTTGLSAADLGKIDAAGRHAVIVRSGNMSMAVNLLAAVVEQVAKTLGREFDIEIVETHHRSKVDAPSGTALMLGEAAARGRKIDLATQSVRVRDGVTGPRRSGDIGFASLRGGSVVGEHTVIFAGPAERLELTHRAEDRSLFASGALRAALWGRGRKPGVYSMRHVLGLAQV
jgi:4-hydroxy-tetrahydrodipicolinate reductase